MYYPNLHLADALSNCIAYVTSGRSWRKGIRNAASTVQRRADLGASQRVLLRHLITAACASKPTDRARHVGLFILACKEILIDCDETSRCDGRTTTEHQDERDQQSTDESRASDAELVKSLRNNPIKARVNFGNRPFGRHPSDKG